LSIKFHRRVAKNIHQQHRRSHTGAAMAQGQPALSKKPRAFASTTKSHAVTPKQQKLNTK